MSVPPVSPTEALSIELWRDDAEKAIELSDLAFCRLRGVSNRDKYIAAVQSQDGRGPCTSVWTAGTIAYRCTDCQTTPASAICIDCFKAGDHEGHDFVMYNSAAGGCCDCGDPSSWRPEGCCDRHRPADEAAAAADLPRAEARVLAAVAGVVATRLASALLDLGVPVPWRVPGAPPRAGPTREWLRDEAAARACLRWLKDVCTVPALRSIVCSSIATPPGEAGAAAADAGGEEQQQQQQQGPAAAAAVAAAALAPPRGVVGGLETDADLRTLPAEKVVELLREFGLTDDEISQLGRWQRIRLVRELSKPPPADNVEGFPPGHGLEGPGDAPRSASLVLQIPARLLTSGDPQTVAAALARQRDAMSSLLEPPGLTPTQHIASALVNLHSDVLQDVVSVLLLMLYSPAYKYEFTAALRYHYSDLILRGFRTRRRRAGSDVLGADDEEEDTGMSNRDALGMAIDRITVQLFNVKEVVVRLCHEGGLLDWLMHALRRVLLGPASHPLVFGCPRVDLQADTIRERAYTRVLSDLKMVLAQPEASLLLLGPQATTPPRWPRQTAEEQQQRQPADQGGGTLPDSTLHQPAEQRGSALEQQGSALSVYLGVLYSCQGMDAHVRKTGEHVLYEKGDYVHALQLEVNLLTFVLTSAIESMTSSIESSTELSPSAPSAPSAPPPSAPPPSAPPPSAPPPSAPPPSAPPPSAPPSALKAPGGSGGGSGFVPPVNERLVGLESALMQAVAVANQWSAGLGEEALPLSGVFRAIHGGKPVSAHIPLHRAVASLTASLLRCTYGCMPPSASSAAAAAVKAALCAIGEGGGAAGPSVNRQHAWQDPGCPGWLRFMGPPVSVLAWMTQIRLRLWLRNGETMQQMEGLYYNSYWVDQGLSMDLMAVQMYLMAEGGADTALRNLLCEFEGQDLWVGTLNMASCDDTWPRDDENDSKGIRRFLGHMTARLGDRGGLTREVLEQGLRLLVMAMRERIHLEQDVSVSMRRVVVHLLACGPCGYSDLQHVLVQMEPSPGAEGGRLDRILQEVADYRPADAHRRGRYTLKPTAWTEWDPYYSRYSRRSLQAAHEAAVASKAWQPRQQLRPVPLHPPMLYEQLAGNVLLQPMHIMLLRMTLLLSLNFPDGVADELALPALNLLAMAIDAVGRSQAQGDGSNAAAATLRELSRSSPSRPELLPLLHRLGTCGGGDVGGGGAGMGAAGSVGEVADCAAEVATRLSRLLDAASGAAAAADALTGPAGAAAARKAAGTTEIAAGVGAGPASPSGPAAMAASGGGGAEGEVAAAAATARVDKRRQMAKEHQQDMMARMRAQQAEALAKMMAEASESEEEEDEEEEQGGAAAGEEGEQQGGPGSRSRPGGRPGTGRGLDVDMRDASRPGSANAAGAAAADALSQARTGVKDQQHGGEEEEEGEEARALPPHCPAAWTCSEATCALCQQGQDGEGVMGLVALFSPAAGPSQALRDPPDWRGCPPPEGRPRYGPLVEEWDAAGCSSADLVVGCHVQCCGHVMHHECYETHTATPLSQRGAGMLASRGEFLCPICRRLNNGLLPVVRSSWADGNSGPQPSSSWAPPRPAMPVEGPAPSGAGSGAGNATDGQAPHGQTSLRDVPEGMEMDVGDAGEGEEEEEEEGGMIARLLSRMERSARRVGEVAGEEGAGAEELPQASGRGEGNSDEDESEEARGGSPVQADFGEQWPLWLVAISQARAVLVEQAESMASMAGMAAVRAREQEILQQQAQRQAQRQAQWQAQGGFAHVVLPADLAPPHWGGNVPPQEEVRQVLLADGLDLLQGSEGDPAALQLATAALQGLCSALRRSPWEVASLLLQPGAQAAAPHHPQQQPGAAAAAGQQQQQQQQREGLAALAAAGWEATAVARAGAAAGVWDAGDQQAAGGVPAAAAGEAQQQGQGADEVQLQAGQLLDLARAGLRPTAVVNVPPAAATWVSVMARLGGAGRGLMRRGRAAAEAVLAELPQLRALAAGGAQGGDEDPDQMVAAVGHLQQAMGEVLAAAEAVERTAAADATPAAGGGGGDQRQPPEGLGALTAILGIAQTTEAGEAGRGAADTAAVGGTAEDMANRLTTWMAREEQSPEAIALVREGSSALAAAATDGGFAAWAERASFAPLLTLPGEVRGAALCQLEGANGAQVAWSCLAYNMAHWETASRGRAGQAQDVHDRSSWRALRSVAMLAMAGGTGAADPARSRAAALSMLRWLLACPDAAAAALNPAAPVVGADLPPALHAAMAADASKGEGLPPLLTSGWVVHEASLAAWPDGLIHRSVSPATALATFVYGRERQPSARRWATEAGLMTDPFGLLLAMWACLVGGTGGSSRASRRGTGDGMLLPDLLQLLQDTTAAVYCAALARACVIACRRTSAPSGEQETLPAEACIEAMTRYLGAAAPLPQGGQERLACVAALLLPFLRRAALLRALVADGPPPPAPPAYPSCRLGDGAACRELLPQLLQEWGCLEAALGLPPPVTVLSGLTEHSGKHALLSRVLPNPLYTAAATPASGNAGGGGSTPATTAVAEAGASAANVHGAAAALGGAAVAAAPGTPLAEEPSLQQQQQQQQPAVGGAGPRRPGWVPLPQPPRLVSLPAQLQDLFLKLGKSRCGRCGRQPTQPALCLQCGELMCCGDRECTPSPLGAGPCRSHAVTCGAGSCLFLMLKHTTLMAARGQRYSTTPSPYLDSHGEEDINMTRGRPLHLAQMRLQEAARLWAANAHDYDSHTLRNSTVARGRTVPI